MTVPPEVIFLSIKNAPKITQAGNPLVKINTSNNGESFFTNYGTDQGLSIRTVLCSIQDKAGNLWFGSGGAGVCRFDGRNYTKFSKSNGLGSNVVFCATMDKDGNLWFGTSSGVSKFNGKWFTNYTTMQGLANNFVNAIIQDQSGNFWIGTDGGGLSKFDGSHFTNYSIIQGLANNYINCLLQDKDGNFWIGTGGGGISKFDGKHFINYTIAQGLPNNSIKCMFQDKAGIIWIGTNGGGLSKYDGKRFENYTTAQGLVNNSVSCITQDNNGALWFGTNVGGVSKYNGSSFENFTVNEGLPNNNISSILKDQIGNLWFTSKGGGVCRYEGSGFLKYNEKQGLSDNQVFFIKQTRDSMIWFGTQGDGVYRYDGKKFENFTKTQGLSDNFIWGINQDKSGDLWIGTIHGGVSKYDGKNFINYTKAQGLPNNTVWYTMQDSKENIWFGTNGGVSKFDGKSFTNYSTVQGLADNNVQIIVEDKKGNMWFATHDGGASMFDGNAFTNYTTESGLPSNTVYNVMEDNDGNIWFGTNAGAAMFNGKSMISFTTAQGLPDNNIWGIEEDRARNILWFETNQGISALKQNKSPADGHTDYVFENYNENTGYPLKDIHGNICIDFNGVLWLGEGDDFVIRFNALLTNKRKDVLPVEIQNIKLGNENICWNNLIRNQHSDKSKDSLILLNEMYKNFGNSLKPVFLDSLRKKYSDVQFDSLTTLNMVPVNLVLPYVNNSLTIEYAAIDPMLAKQVKFQYRLDEDKVWSPLSNNSSAVFSNLREGDYLFDLKALSPYGVWSELKYNFRILPPWQRTWWAYSLFILSGGIILIGLVNYRSKQLRRENRILEEKVSNRTKELKEQKEKVETTLAELKSTQSQLIQSEKMASLGELTAGIAHEIQNPLNFVNNFSELNRELISEMKQEMDKENLKEIRSIISDIEENEKKINHHGKRAEEIVKGMLQHSRTSSGYKELTDINSLAGEYLRLRYQALKNADKEHPVHLITDFDETIGRINIIPQEIGRVLLNLYNNAFYAVAEKSRTTKPEGYLPTVSVSTRVSGTQIRICVRDNGNGISKKIIGKIFQPFYTTKPPGQGTGLGLSLSYDIIRAHDGQIKVDSIEGEFTEFAIEIPAHA